MLVQSQPSRPALLQSKRAEAPSTGSGCLRERPSTGSWCEHGQTLRMLTPVKTVASSRKCREANLNQSSWRSRLGPGVPGTPGPRIYPTVWPGGPGYQIAVQAFCLKFQIPVQCVTLDPAQYESCGVQPPHDSLSLGDSSVFVRYEAQIRCAFKNRHVFQIGKLPKRTVRLLQSIIDR